MSFDCNNQTYIKKIIETVRFSPRTDGIGQRNDNLLVTDMPQTMISNLSPTEQSFKSNYDLYSDDKRNLSNEIEFSKSPSVCGLFVKSGCSKTSQVLSHILQPPKKAIYLRTF